VEPEPDPSGPKLFAKVVPDPDSTIKLVPALVGYGSKIKAKIIILMVKNVIVIFTLVFSPARGGSNFMLRSGFSSS
jgi:hypothetical protein